MPGARDPVTAPHWPALMAIETACAYLSLSAKSFRWVTAARGVAPVDLGIGVTRWRKADLDGLVDKLTTRGAVLAQEALAAPDPADLALERAARRARR